MQMGPHSPAEGGGWLGKWLPPALQAHPSHSTEAKNCLCFQHEQKTRQKVTFAGWGATAPFLRWMTQKNPKTTKKKPQKKTKQKNPQPQTEHL